MGIYHLSVSIIKRSEGRSCVAAAAYISGEKLYNSYDGCLHDFSRKGHVEYKEIMLPQNAPETYKERNVLWNAVEASEKSSKAQLARSIIIALPKELTFDQQKELLKEYVEDNFVSKGMCADIAIHNPPKTNYKGIPIDESGNIVHDSSEMYYNNPHAHILLTMRPIDANGKWEAKSQVVYMCERGNEEKGFTADEMIQATADGWQKQYAYMDGKKKKWLTADEASGMGLKRVSRNPKTAPFGKVNPNIEEWNSLESLKAWRKNWEEYANRAYEKYSVNERIDSRSFVEQGRMNEIPSVHIGPAASHIMLPDNTIADRKDLNEYINRYNKWLSKATKKYHETIDKVNEYIRNVALSILNTRKELIKLRKQKSNLEDKIDKISSENEIYNSIVTILSDEYAYIQKANEKSERKINQLREEYAGKAFLSIADKKKISRQIAKESGDIVKREENFEFMLEKCNVSSLENLEDIRKKVEALESQKEVVEATVKGINDKIVVITDYQHRVMDDITEEMKEAILDECNNMEGIKAECKVQVGIRR